MTFLTTHLRIHSDNWYDIYVVSIFDTSDFNANIEFDWIRKRSLKYEKEAGIIFKINI